MMSAMLKIVAFTFGLFGVNTYIVWNPGTRQAVVVDPGMMYERENQQLDSFITANALEVGQIINTHLHVDHIFGNKYVAGHYGVKAAGGEADAFLGEQAPAQCRMFSLPMSLDAVTLDEYLTDGQKINVCGEEVTVMAAPGHSPGSMVLYFPDSHWVITGDVLFKGSIGRTDLVAGNHALLLKSIREKLLTLPPSTVVYPGHGEPTTIGAEAEDNSFL